jgi:DNA-binding MarR family transcriptional regulator
MTNELSVIEEMAQQCLAVRVRLIGRAITSLYDHAIESDGMTIAQVNLLVALGKVGSCSPTKLGTVMEMERSTVSRNLDRLLKAGWVRVVSSDDKGIREIVLSQRGYKKLESILPHWREAQEQAANLLGSAGVHAVRKVAEGFWEQPAG